MKHLKPFAILPAILIILTCFSGCGAYIYESNGSQPRPGNSSWGSDQGYESTEPSSSIDEKLFVMEEVGSDGYFHYYRDTITDVLYVAFWKSDEGGLTTMLDPETGLPLTYTRYLEIASQELGVDVTETTP